MKRFPLLFAAALLGAAISSPAQHNRSTRGNRSAVPAAQHPVRHHSPQRHDTRQRGHWETRCEQVLVPGYWHEQHVPATYGWIYSQCGHRHWGLIDRGGCRRVWVPERWETRTRRVWVPC